MLENKNLILAVVLSVAILFVSQFLTQMLYPQRAQAPSSPQTQTSRPMPPGTAPPAAVPGSGISPPGAGTGLAAPEPVPSPAQVLAQTARIRINTPALHGSIALVGGRIDDVTLASYRETLDPNSPEIVLFSPLGTADAYFAETGWVAAGGGAGAGANYALDRRQRYPDLRHPGDAYLGQRRGLALQADLHGRRQLHVHRAPDRREPGRRPVSLLPYSLITRYGTPPTSGFFILYEGPLGVFNGTLDEVSYEDVQEKGVITRQTTGGWIGITDKYWLSALIPDQQQPITARFVISAPTTANQYQVDFVGPQQTLAPGASIESESRLFAGAKVVTLIDHYEEQYGIKRFDLSIDWGWFYFLTRPVFYFLNFLPRPGRQLRHRHPAADGGDQARLLPARQQVLQGDEPDAQAAAGDAEAARALRRRPGAAQPGDDGALQAGEGQPGLRLPADRHPDPGVLRALQGAVRHHRDAARAVLRLDPRPLGARSDLDRSTCSG